MYCKNVWNGIFILPDGHIRLCSLGRYADFSLDFQRARDKQHVPMHILTHELNEIVNSDKHREVRLLNKNNPDNWSPHCDCCEIREKVTSSNHNQSRRIFLKNINTTHVDKNIPLQHLDNEGNVPWLPSSLDINFGNLCNLKCIMCSPDFSNQWYNEWFGYWKTKEIGQSTKTEVKFNNQNKKWITPELYKWHESPIWWRKFEEMAPYLRHIYITGGEPMITASHDEMLDRLIERNFSKNIFLEYDSNCTTINGKIISRWEKFKKVHIRASMDGINEQYELIRYPGKWKTFDENVRTLKNLMLNSNGKIELTCITSCFQISNSFDQVKADNYCKELEIPYHIRFLEGPMYMSTESLNETSKNDLIQFYTKNYCTKSNMIIKYFKHRLETSKPDRIFEYIKFMNYLDSTRKTNWKIIFSDLYKMLCKNYQEFKI